MKKLIGAVILTLLFVTNVPAQTGQVTFEWTPPATGDIDHYVCYAVTDTTASGSTVDTQVVFDTRATLTIPDDVTIWVRVFAVDVRGKSGSLSPWSVSYHYESPPPSACGQPWLVRRQ